MADEQSPDRRGRSGDPPWEVEITILPVDRPPALRERLRHAATDRPHPGRLLMAILIAAALGAGAVLTLQGGSPLRHRRGDALTQPGAPGVAAAYGYPARCLSIDFAPADSAYARADFDRRTPCGRFAGYPTAVFHRVRGAWRAVLEALSYTCPVRSLPASVQTELDVCPAPAR